MKTGEWRGAGPFAADWILEPGRQEAHVPAGPARWIEVANGDNLVLKDPSSANGWVRIDDAVNVRDWL